MRNFLLPILLLGLPALITGCGSGGEKAEAVTAENAPPDPDSLRQAYLAFRRQQTDTLPSRHLIEAGKLYPVDEAPLDTAFFVLQQDLINAIERKDIFRVMACLDPQIKVGFGEENGIDAFIKNWGLRTQEDIQKSELWAVLGDVLRGGGIFQDNGRRFVAPYVYAAWPDTYDAFTHLAVTGEGVRLRQTPNSNGPILTMVNYDIVGSLGFSDNTETIGGETYPWAHIKTLSGTEGYVWGKFVRSPISYRAGFEQRDGRWKMVFLVSGD